MLLCSDTLQGVNFRILLYTLTALVFPQMHIFVFLPNVWILIIWLSFLFVMQLYSPHCLQGLINNVLCQLFQHSLRRATHLEDPFPWLNALLLHGCTPIYWFHLQTYIQSVQSIKLEVPEQGETVCTQPIFFHDTQYIWSFPDACRQRAPVSLI